MTESQERYMAKAEKNVRESYKRLAGAVARLKEYDFTTVNYGAWGSFALYNENRDVYAREVADSYKELYFARMNLAECQRNYI